jgi:hypothetical protein
MSLPLFERTPLDEAFAALRRDLVADEGPRISTMRNYRFAIVQYDPNLEFKLRRLTQQLYNDLVAHGWVVVTIDLQRVLLDRVRAQGDEWASRVIEMERRLSMNAPGPGTDRALNYLKSKLEPLIEGPEGIAADVATRINAFTEAHPDKAERTLALVGRAGALYPFFRSSALLKHLDGRTGHVPVVLLYPGERRGPTGLSFMGVLDPDNDYRPRIYP